MSLNSKNDIFPKIHFLYDFDEVDANAKGYLNDVIVEMADGSMHHICFYDTARVIQEIEEDTKSGDIFFESNKLIVLKKITYENIKNAIASLSKSKIFFFNEYYNRQYKEFKDEIFEITNHNNILNGPIRLDIYPLSEINYIYAKDIKEVEYQYEGKRIEAFKLTGVSQLEFLQGAGCQMYIVPKALVKNQCKESRILPSFIIENRIKIILPNGQIALKEIN